MNEKLGLKTMGSAASAIALAGSLLLAASAEAVVDIRLERDWNNTVGLYNEAYGDDRSINTTNPAPAGTTFLSFEGAQSVGFGCYQPDPPLFGIQWRYPGGFPEVHNYFDHNVLSMHPGTGGFEYGTGTANVGASVSFAVPTTDTYFVVGTFARANTCEGAGNGVDVTTFVDSDSDQPMFAGNVSSNHAVDPDHLYEGTGIAPFAFRATLSEGQRLRFVVFSDSQGQDGTFDSTALRANVSTEPALALRALIEDLEQLRAVTSTTAVLETAKSPKTPNKSRLLAALDRVRKNLENGAGKLTIGKTKPAKSSFIAARNALHAYAALLETFVAKGRVTATDAGPLLGKAVALAAHAQVLGTFAEY